MKKYIYKMKDKSIFWIIVLFISVGHSNYAQLPVQQFWAANRMIIGECWDHIAGNGVIDNGSGNWDSTTANWHAAYGGGNNIWPSTCSNVIFGGNPGVEAAGTITLNSAFSNIKGMFFRPAASGNFTISNGGIAANTISGCNGVIPIFVESSLAPTISAIISGTTSIRKLGTGTLILTENNTYTGTTTNNAGTLQVGNGSTNATLGIGETTNNGDLFFKCLNNIVFSNISGSGTLRFETPGTVGLISNSNISQNSITGSYNSMSVNAISWTAPTMNMTGHLNIAGTNIINATGGSANFSGTSVDNYPIIFSNAAILMASGNVTLSGTYSGASSIYGGISFDNGTLRNYAGKLRLLAVSTGRVAFTAGTSSGNGVFILGTVEIEGTAQAYTAGYRDIMFPKDIFGDGVVTLIGNKYGVIISGNIKNSNGQLGVKVITTDPVNGYVEIKGIVSATNGLTFDVAGNISVITGSIQGGGITKEGAGTIQLNGANTYSGATTINGGTLKAGSAKAFGGSTITINPGGTLNKGGFVISNTIVNNGGTIIQ